MQINNELLLYPLIPAEPPSCPGCGKTMEIASHEARRDAPDFATFRCRDCIRSETFVVDDD